MTREHLPNDRTGVTQKFTIVARRPGARGEPDGTENIKGYISTGVYADGRLGELFVHFGKPGCTEAAYDQWAIAVSIALQHGATVEEVFSKFARTNFEPSGGVLSVAGITRCSSPLDLISRWILGKYGSTLNK